MPTSWGAVLQRCSQNPHYFMLNKNLLKILTWITYKKDQLSNRRIPYQADERNKISQTDICSHSKKYVKALAEQHWKSGKSELVAKAWPRCVTNLVQYLAINSSSKQMKLSTVFYLHLYMRQLLDTLLNCYGKGKQEKVSQPTFSFIG